MSAHRHTEPRQEAERIVGWLLHELVETNDAVTGSDYERWKRHHDSLVDVLAAGIEWHDVQMSAMEVDEEYVYHSMTGSDIGLLQAIGRLRGDITK